MFIIIDVVLLLTGATLQITLFALLSLILILQLAVLGMSIGILVSSLTVKYRDLQVLVSFGVQLWMYLSPVVYSVSSIGNETLKTLIMFNPVTPIIELLRKGFVGVGTVSWLYYGISVGITLLLAFISIVIFNKTERNFIDKI